MKEREREKKKSWEFLVTVRLAACSPELLYLLRRAAEPRGPVRCISCKVGRAIHSPKRPNYLPTCLLRRSFSSFFLALSPLPFLSYRRRRRHRSRRITSGKENTRRRRSISRILCLAFLCVCILIHMVNFWSRPVAEKHYEFAEMRARSRDILHPVNEWTFVIIFFYVVISVKVYAF